MKKIIALLFSFALMFSLLPSFVFAFPGGLLEGKQTDYYMGNFIRDSRTECTDGLVSTRCVNIGPNESVRYTFPNPVVITASQLDTQGEGTNANFEFYDPSGKLIATKSISTSKTIYNEPIQNVKFLRVQPIGIISIYEFDVWGEDATAVPTNPLNLTANAGNTRVDLSWDSVPNSIGYNIYRDGIKINNDVLTQNSYVDSSVANGINYKYVVKAVNNNGESGLSNEAIATPIGPVVQPDTGRALLNVTFTTGLEKEYDLSLTEVNSFISWYEGKAVGTGTASFAIDKHANNKGPFKTRKDYVIFDKILTFEVSEYEITE